MLVLLNRLRLQSREARLGWFSRPLLVAIISALLIVSCILILRQHWMLSLLDPNAIVQPNQRFYRVVTANGEEVSGRLLNQDIFSVQLLDMAERLRSFDKGNLREFGFLPSPMPSLQGSFDGQELADLVQYLVSLRGAETP